MKKIIIMLGAKACHTMICLIPMVLLSILRAMSCNLEVKIQVNTALRLEYT